MKYGITNTAYYNDKMKYVDYKKMHEHGFNCGDYQQLANPEGEIYKISEDDFKSSILKEKKEADKNGITFSQVHAPFYVCDVDSQKLKKLTQVTQKAVYATKLLGCKHLVVHTIMPQPWGEKENLDKTTEINIEFFNKICKYGQENDVCICAENLPFKEHHLSYIPELLNFIGNLNQPNLFVCFDTGHSHICKENIKDMIELCGNKLKVFHIHDNKSNSDIHIPPYTGNINWEEFKCGLKSIKFNGCLSLETEFKRNCPFPLRDILMKSLCETLKFLGDFDNNEKNNKNT